jgi:predicted AlkP superfamily pyrophosphatase or phosphodiesterase
MIGKEPSMNRLTVLFTIAAFILLFLLTHQAEPGDLRSHSRTILISFDGAQPEVIERLLEQRKLSKNGGFAELIAKGTKAKGMTSVLPTLTATNHIALATNIPMNTFHNTESPLTSTTSGFAAPIDGDRKH